MTSVPSAPADAELTDPRSDALSSATPVTLVLTAALIAAVLLGIRFGVRFESPLTVILLTVIALVAETFASLVQRFSSMSLTSTLVGVAGVLCGPLGACLVGALGTGLIVARLPRTVRYFNAAMTGWVGILGGLTLDALVPEASSRGTFWVSEHIGALVLPMIVMTIAMMLVNALLISLIIKVTAAVPFNRSLRDFGMNSSPLFLIGGLISYLIVVLWVGARVGPFTVLVMAPPLLLAQWAYSSMAAEASNVDHAVDVLADALELNRPGSRQHGDLVTVIAEEIGNVAGLPDSDISALRRAARLHHLGTMRASRPGASTIDRHSSGVGADLVAPIDYLDATGTIIATQANPMGERSAAAATLAVADALASTIEHRMIASGEARPDRQLIDACIAQVGARNDLEPAVRAALATAPASTLAGRITMSFAGGNQPAMHEGTS